MSKRNTKSMARQIAEMVNGMTTEQYLNLLNMADPNPMSADERAEYDAMSDDDLLVELEGARQ